MKRRVLPWVLTVAVATSTVPAAAFAQDSIGNEQDTNGQTEETNGKNEENAEKPQDADGTQNGETPEKTNENEEQDKTDNGQDTAPEADGEKIAEQDKGEKEEETKNEPASDQDEIAGNEEQAEEKKEPEQEIIGPKEWDEQENLAEKLIATYAGDEDNAAQVEFVANLGQPIWTDENKTAFRYNNASVVCELTGDIDEDTELPKISILTITVTDGGFTTDSIYTDDEAFKVTDVSGKSATWFLKTPQTPEEIQEKLREVVFTHKAGMEVSVIVDGNENKGFENALPEGSFITSWTPPGETKPHYYLYYKEYTNWANAYNKALDFKLGGRQGYLVTLTSNDEMAKMLDIAPKSGNSWTPLWVGATRLSLADGQKINGKFSNTDGTLGYYGGIDNAGAGAYYWASGPESGKGISGVSWGTNQPDGARYSNGVTGPITMSNVQGRESCLMILANEGKLNDIYEGNYATAYSHLACIGYVIEFGGEYTDENGDPTTDPGGRKDSLASESNSGGAVTAKAEEAKINGAELGTLLSDALYNAIAAGDVVTIVSDKVTPVTEADFMKGVTLKKGNYTYKALESSVIDVDENGTVTIHSGQVEVSDNTPIKVVIGDNTYDVTASVGSKVNMTGAAYAEVTGEAFVTIDNVKYTVKQGETARVFIPDGMKNNNSVTKAEVAGGKTADIAVSNDLTVKAEPKADGGVEVRCNEQVANAVDVVMKKAGDTVTIKDAKFEAIADNTTIVVSDKNELTGGGVKLPGDGTGVTVNGTEVTTTTGDVTVGNGHPCQWQCNGE